MHLCKRLLQTVPGWPTCAIHFSSLHLLELYMKFFQFSQCFTFSLFLFLFHASQVDSVELAYLFESHMETCKYIVFLFCMVNKTFHTRCMYDGLLYNNVDESATIIWKANQRWCSNQKPKSSNVKFLLLCEYKVKLAMFIP